MTQIVGFDFSGKLPMYNARPVFGVINKSIFAIF